MRKAAIMLMMISSAHTLLGQVETTQYFMNTLPQVVDANPAFLPKFNFALGLPFSRVSATYANNGFTYDEAIRNENGVRIFDIAKWQSVLPEKTYITNSTQVDLLRIGVKVGSNVYVSLHSTAREMAQAMFPKDIAVLLTGGTGAYVGQTAHLAPEFHGITMWETGLGVSFAPTEKLRIGVKVKKVYGAQALDTEHADISLSVADDYSMTATADVLVRTSGIDDSVFVFKDYLKNSGWSGDFGVTYKVLPRITLAASVVDLGYIKWRNDLTEYAINPATANYTFRGLDVKDMINGNTDAFDQQLDSLKEDFKLTKSTGSAFSMMLPSKMYMSAGIDITKSFAVGGLFYATQFNGRTGVGWTTSVNKNFGRWLSTSLSYTVSNRSYNNFGAGVALKLGPVQIYAVGDNVVGMPISFAKSGYINDHLNKAHVLNGRFGVNFVWGWKKETDPNAEDNSKSFNSGKKDKTKQISDDNSKSYNGKKSSGSKATSNAKKQPQAKKKKQPAHIRLRQKMKP